MFDVLLNEEEREIQQRARAENSAVQKMPDCGLE